MSATLRPMNLGEILDRTFVIYRKRLLMFIGIAALPLLPVAGIQIAGNRWFHLNDLVSSSNSDSMGWKILLWLGYEHAFTFLSLLFMPAIVGLTSREFLGEKGSFSGSLRFALARWKSYVWLGILKLTAGMLFPEFVVAASILIEAYTDITIGHNVIGQKLGPIFTIGFPASTGGIFFFWFGASLALTIPAAALENLSGVRALHRSWRLSKGSRLRILFTWMAIFASFWIANIALEMLLGQIIYYLSGALHFEDAGRKLYEVAAFPMYLGVAAMLGSIYPIAITLIYYDQRIRREGYDIEMLMEAAGLGAIEAPARTASSAD